MQPSYSRDVKGIVQQWYEAVEKNVGYNEEIELYQNTRQVIKTLRELKNSGQIEKVKELTNILISKFNKYDVGESELLADWVARHSKVDEITKKFTGAYKFLHQLFQFMADINDYPQAFTTDYDTSPSAWHLSSIINVDAAALSYMKPDILQITDIKRLIFSKLDLKSQCLFGETSKSNEELYKSNLTNLVDLLNSGKIVIRDLGFKSITEFINCFGKENCSKITRIDLTGLYAGNRMVTRTPVESVNISESFPKLRHFSFKGDGRGEFNCNHLNLPKTLESLCLTNCRVKDWSFMKSLKSLRILDIPNSGLSNAQSFFFVELELLEVVNVSNNLIEHQVVFYNNLKLVDLDIRNTDIGDISFIKTFPLLEKFCFGNNSMRDYNTESIFASMGVLKECASLKSLVIDSLLVIEKKFLNFLRLPNLEYLTLFDTENSDFLSHCTSLKSLKCEFKDLTFLEKCPQITKLVLGPTTTRVDLRPLFKLENLEEIEFLKSYLREVSVLEEIPLLKEKIKLIGYPIRNSRVPDKTHPSMRQEMELLRAFVRNFSFLEKMSSVKKVILHLDISDEQIKELTSKGITVIKKQ